MRAQVLNKHYSGYTRKSGNKSCGNNICLIDTTYKTTKYKLPLFFVCVRTNVGYSAVAQFIVQQEGANEIEEALEVLKLWNPTWKPDFIMSDYSQLRQKLELYQMHFLQLQLTCVTFTGNNAGSGGRRTRLMTYHQRTVREIPTLELLRACAHAPPATEEGLEIDHHYKSAEALLKGSDVFKENPQVKFWLSNRRLNIPQPG